MRAAFRYGLIAALALPAGACVQNSKALLDEQKAELGRQIFFDTSLSKNSNQSCAGCHSPSAGFSDPSMHASGVSEGSDTSKFGTRNTPAIGYAMFSPPAHFDAEAGTMVGGQFLDHRAASLAEQALKPFLNPVEMANANGDAVVTKIMGRPYAADFRKVFGDDAFSDKSAAYRMIGEALAEFERGTAFGKFDSKFDAVRRGLANFTDEEDRGLALFNGKANCAACHPSAGAAPLFTDFTNDNIGVPKNTEIPINKLGDPAYDASFSDRGLGAILDDTAFDGRFKVPSLRNVAITAPYMHNGFFKNLREVVRFYNSACAAGNPDNWDTPEFTGTQNCKELGDLGLSDDEIDAIVAFLGTLTDGYSN
ncbi:MAG: cytochrome c peroxidase [Turneriella sp.]